MQRGEDALDAALGHVTDHRVGGDDGEDDGGVEHRAAEDGERRGAAEQDDRQRGEMVAHDRGAGLRPVHRQHVAAVREATSLGLEHGESALRRCRETIDDLLGLDRVPCGLGAVTVAVAAGTRGGGLAADGGQELPHVEAARVESHEDAAGERIRRDAVDGGVTRQSRLHGVGERRRATQHGQTHPDATGNGERDRDDDGTAVDTSSRRGGHRCARARGARTELATTGSRRTAWSAA